MTVRTSQPYPVIHAPVTISPDALVRLTQLAVAAGHATMAHYHTGVVVEKKSDQSPVTAADHAAHTIIMQGLGHWDPSIPIISEEGEIPGAAERAGWHRFWLVDPLDGTKEFIQQNGEFTVNIALIERGVPVLGVIYAPAMDLLYYAGEGLGAWRRIGEGTPQRIYSDPPLPGHALRVAESRSHPSKELEEYLATLPVKERVPAGSSLKFCRVAEGAADLYPRLGPTMEWDVAAGDCIFRNSGRLRPRVSKMTYNQPELRNSGFVVGLDDQEVETASKPGMVLWFTGLSGSGKTTIAREVIARLEAAGRAVELLDGDAIRELFPATGFTRPDRDAHIKRVGWLASRLERHGVIVVASLVSPYVSSRDFVRGLCRDFREIYISTSFAECEKRDVKGLYARARAGEVKNFTGLDDPYEPPVKPELMIDTTMVSVDQASAQVLGLLR